MIDYADEVEELWGIVISMDDIAGSMKEIRVANTIEHIENCVE
jgi:hypothetical protein